MDGGINPLHSSYVMHFYNTFPSFLTDDPKIQHCMGMPNLCDNASSCFVQEKPYSMPQIGFRIEVLGFRTQGGAGCMLPCFFPESTPYTLWSTMQIAGKWPCALEQSAEPAFGSRGHGSRAILVYILSLSNISTNPFNRASGCMLGPLFLETATSMGLNVNP